MSYLYSNPATKAQQTVAQIPGAVSPYFQPYVDAGGNALNTLQDQYGNLIGNYGDVQNQYTTAMNDPASILKSLGAGYQESPGYQWELSQGEQAINNAQAAGGMTGTPQHQQEAGALATNLANKDFQQYLAEALGVYNTGVKGATNLYNTGLSGFQGINQMGYSASSNLAEAIAQSLMKQAELQYAGQANKNQHRGGMLGNAVGIGLGVGVDKGWL
jgi:hypothetical protein